MLGNPHFYNRTIRKVVVAFGTLFNDLEIIRFNKANQPQLKMTVPLSYGAKEKYLTRILSDPNLTKSVNTVVPRMSFNLDSLSYDISRKQQSLLQNFAYNSESGLSTQFVPVPYNFEFSLSIFVRHTEDGTQILEQILPFFTPDFTVTVDFINAFEQKYDMPIILNSVTSNVDYEGDMSTTRLIIWDLSFTAKGYIWPPVKVGGGLIGQYSDVGGLDGTGGFGGVIGNVYVDPTLNTKTAKVEVQSNPLDAEPDDGFGFTETITEYFNAQQYSNNIISLFTTDSTIFSTDSIIITTDKQ
jgi:hypothetical protein